MKMLKRSVSSDGLNPICKKIFGISFARRIQNISAEVRRLQTVEGIAAIESGQSLKRTSMHKTLETLNHACECRTNIKLAGRCKLAGLCCCC